ncbi:MAG: hypothetical protein ACLFUB_05845 [Cyclobacteriaceae bacterium]
MRKTETKEMVVTVLLKAGEIMREISDTRLSGEITSFSGKNMTRQQGLIHDHLNNHKLISM